MNRNVTGTIDTLTRYDSPLTNTTILTAPQSQIETRTEEDMIVKVREHLLEAVRLRLRADVPVGIYLSGGIDSSVIAGMVNHLVKELGLKMGSNDPKQRICCFSIAFDKSSGKDESGMCDTIQLLPSCVDMARYL